MRDNVAILLHLIWMQVGAHELSVEEPDLVVIRVRGPARASEIHKISQLLRATGKRGTVYLMTHLETAEFEGSPEGRRHFVETTRGLTTMVTAVVGANFRFRVILRFVENLVRMMSKLKLHIQFFDDETSARAWLQTQECVACGANGPQASIDAGSMTDRNGLSG